MKGEKGIPGVTVGDGLGEELTDETFSKLAYCPFRVFFSFSYEAFTSIINVDQANYHTLDL